MVTIFTPSHAGTDVRVLRMCVAGVSFAVAALVWP